MKIGELSKLTGFSRDTIRYYHELGLLDGHVIQGENNYREFSNGAVKILKQIEESKTYGFTLRENKALLELINERDKKLDLMDKFLSKRIEKNNSEMKKLKEQNERLWELSAEIENCRQHCN